MNKKIVMKNVILILGGIALTLNTLIGFLTSSFDSFHLLLTDVSILLSFAFIYLNMQSDNKDGFKVGLSIVYALSGMLRYVFALLAKSEIKDNPFLILLTIFIFIELACFALARFLSSRT